MMQLNQVLNIAYVTLIVMTYIRLKTHINDNDSSQLSQIIVLLPVILLSYQNH
jgi:hypothetical protein